MAQPESPSPGSDVSVSGVTHAAESLRPAAAAPGANEPAPAPARPAAKILPVGHRFGRYAIVGLLGSGGMGAVYEATHVDLKKRVALKILHPVFTVDDDVHARFMREGESAARIRHPHVVDITDFGVVDDVPYLVMEFLEGESLSARVKRGPLLPITEAIDIMLPVCAAVAAAHDARVIHRDLKPENVFLARVGKGEIVPKVVDFGVSKLTDASASALHLTSTNSLVGSPAYMSPEQILASKEVDARSDQYALGVTVYECLTGAKPFIAETLFEMMGKVVEGDCVAARERRPEIPVGLDEVIRRAMHPKAPERFDTVHSLGRALLPFASERGRLLWAGKFGADAGTAHADLTPAQAQQQLAAMAPISVLSASSSRSGTRSAAASGSISVSAAEVDASRSIGDQAPVKRGWIPWAAVGLVAVLGVLGTTARRWMPGDNTPVQTDANPRGIHATPEQPVRAETFTARVTVQPAGAAIDLDGLPAGTGSFDRTFARDGLEHTLRVHADGYITRDVVFRDGPPPASIVLAAQTPGPSVTPPATTQSAAEPPRHETHAADVHPRSGHAANPSGTRPHTQAGHAVGINGAAIME